MLRTKINVNLGVSRDCKDYDIEMQKVMIYCLAVREEAKAFLLTFISFYLLYLIYETWFFFSFEVNLKRKKKNKNKNETVA